MQGLSAFQAAELRRVSNERHHFTGPMGPWLEHLVQDEGLSMGQARDTLSNWEVLPYIDEKLGHMATLIKRNKEVHFAIYRRFRHRNNVTIARIRSFLQPLLDKEIFLVTKIAHGEDARFIQHLGFEQLGVTIEGMHTFILNEIKYPRAHHATTIRS